MVSQETTTSNELSANGRLWASPWTSAAKGGPSGAKTFVWAAWSAGEEKSQPGTQAPGLASWRTKPPRPQATSKIRRPATSPIYSRTRRYHGDDASSCCGAASKMRWCQASYALRRLMGFDRWRLRKRPRLKNEHRKTYFRAGSILR